MQKSPKLAKSGPGAFHRLSFKDSLIQKSLNLDKSGPGPFEAFCKGPLNAKIAKFGKIWVRSFRGSL